MDPETGLEILASAAVSKNTIERILGPTADYIGEGLRAWTERRVENVQRVFRKAVEKLGARLDAPGGVPPRVLMAVLAQAHFAEDELMAEYLGGVLASSRTEIGRDDRAAMIAATIGRLSTYALRTHYVLYAAAQPLFPNVDFRSGGQERNARVFVTTEAYAEAMDFSNQEEGGFNDIFSDAMHDLARKYQIDDEEWAIGEARALAKFNVQAPDAGLVYRLTNPGITLFCAAHGIRSDPLGRYATAPRLAPIAGVRVPDAVIVHEFPPFPIAARPLGGRASLAWNVP